MESEQIGKHHRIENSCVCALQITIPQYEQVGTTCNYFMLKKTTEDIDNSRRTGLIIVHKGHNSTGSHFLPVEVLVNKTHRQ